MAGVSNPDMYFFNTGKQRIIGQGQQFGFRIPADFFYSFPFGGRFYPLFTHFTVAGYFQGNGYYRTCLRLYHSLADKQQKEQKKPYFIFHTNVFNG